MESAFCPACGARFERSRRYHRFCSRLCQEVFSGKRFIGPVGHVITCAVCGERKAVQVSIAKTCAACAPEWARRRNIAWREANPELYREYNQLRDARPHRREYQRDRSVRRRALKAASRWAEAAEAIVRPTPLALPPAPSRLGLPRPVMPEGPSCSLADAPRPRQFIPCAECGVLLVLTRAPDAYHRRRFCSKAHSKRFWRREYRRLQSPANDPDIRRSIFRLDDYVCQLCKGPTRPDLEGSHYRNLAPTIDHIVPLAAGGVDTVDNFQTAHRYCNSVKRDLDMEEFERRYVAPLRFVRGVASVPGSP